MARSRRTTPKQASSPTTFADIPLYLVRRLYEGAWESIFCNSAAFDCPQRPEWGGPVKAFTRRSQADAFRQSLDAKLLQGRNPFELQGGELRDLTSLPPDPFRDWLRDVGLDPLPVGKERLTHWCRWWEKQRSVMSEEQHRRLLAGLDKLHLCAVFEMEPPAKTSGRESATVRKKPKGVSLIDVFTVELLKWKDDDDFLADQSQTWMNSHEPCFSRNGGLRLATFRDHGKAVVYRDELQSRIPRECRTFYRNGFGVAEHSIEVED